MAAKKRILLAVLNWGLGHASRCAPLVKHLEAFNCEVVLASDGAALKHLKSAFPQNSFIELPSLNVHYESKLGAAFSIIRQLPKLFIAIQKEKQFLDQLIEKDQFDLIISDNRYGIYHEQIPSIILSHQLNIQAPIGKRGINILLHKYLNRFDYCWVPDDEKHALSGSLSSSKGVKVAIEYIGALSHFMDQTLIADESKVDAFLAILSGPEPLRTQFEMQLIQQASRDRVRLKIVRGSNTPLPKEYAEIDCVEAVNMLQADELYKEISMHKGVICRAGYSSIMDLTCLKKPALLIPTPKQSEQEYLAKIHMRNGNFYSVTEGKLNLKSDLAKAFSGEFKPKESSLKLNEQRELIRNSIAGLIQR